MRTAPKSAATTLSGNVLVLNQGYEPISVCSVKKAFMLMYLSKAELVEHRSGVTIKSMRTAYPFPSVIRLQSYIRVPYKRVELSRKNIMRRDSFRCQYCGSHSHPLTLDHVIPKSRGGGDVWENLVAACIPCNNRKGSRTPEEAGLRLLSTPRKPNHIVYLSHFMGKVDEPWKQYLFIG